MFLSRGAAGGDAGPIVVAFEGLWFRVKAIRGRMKAGRRPRRPCAKMVVGSIAAGGDAGPPYVAFCEWALRGRDCEDFCRGARPAGTPALSLLRSRGFGFGLRRYAGV